MADTLLIYVRQSPRGYGWEAYFPYHDRRRDGLSRDAALAKAKAWKEDEAKRGVRTKIIANRSTFRTARRNPLGLTKKQMYWVGGGAGALALGTILYFALRKKEEVVEAGASSDLSSGSSSSSVPMSSGGGGLNPDPNVQQAALNGINIARSMVGLPPLASLPPADQPGLVPTGTPPNPQNYVGNPNQFSVDLNKWFQGALGALQTFAKGSEMFNAIYSQLQGVIANFGYLLPANPLPVF